MNAAIHLQIVGVMLVLLAVANLLLPRQFNWQDELKKVDLLARQVFFVHLYYIAFVVLLMGLMTLFYADELLAAGELGRMILAGLSVFWASRLFVQWFVYDRELWLGDRLRTAIHFLLTFVWGYFAGVYGLASYLSA